MLFLKLLLTASNPMQGDKLPFALALVLLLHHERPVRGVTGALDRSGLVVLHVVCEALDVRHAGLSHLPG